MQVEVEMNMRRQALLAQQQQAQMMRMRQQQQEALQWQQADIADFEVRRRNAFSNPPSLNPTAANYVPEGELDTSLENILAMQRHAPERRNAIAGPTALAPLHTIRSDMRGPGGREVRATGAGASQTTDARQQLTAPPSGLNRQFEAVRQRARADFESRLSQIEQSVQIPALETTAAGQPKIPAPQEWNAQMQVPYTTHTNSVLAAHEHEHGEFRRDQLARISRNNDTGGS
jgi:hypothetical protein